VHSLVAYLTLTLILAVTPGSTTAVVVRNTLAAGRAAGFAAASGAALGNTLQATAAGLGLAVLLARWPAAMTIVRVLGAAYLAWLGAVSLWRASTRKSGLAVLPEVGEPPRDGQSASFRQGLTVNLLNPAISTFYLVVVTSFVPPGAPRWYYAALALMHIAMAFGCHGFWTMAFDSLRHIFGTPTRRMLLEGATGVAMICLAIRVVLQV
jgi:threonine/homoserine/homoserine lactone efflux protein